VNQVEEEGQSVAARRGLGKGMTFLNMEIMNFEQEMEMFNQNFMARFNEIRQCLDAMPPAPVAAKNASNQAAFTNSPRNSAKHRLMHALHFSKNLDDN